MKVCAVMDLIPSYFFQRWLNRDPLGERGGLNLYGYVENNPMSFVDPLSKCRSLLLTLRWGLGTDGTCRASCAYSILARCTTS